MDSPSIPYEFGRAGDIGHNAPSHGRIRSLQSLCLDVLASRFAARDPAFASEALSGLSADLLERLQHILIAKNALNDYSLVMTTSSRQTSLTIPFSMTDEEQNLSEVSVLQALTKCEASLKNLHVIANDLTPQVLEKITSEPLKSNLVTLSLSGCRVSLPAAQRILSTCTSLQHLNLNGNPDINDDLFVPVRSTTGARNGHVYSTRSGLMTSSPVSSELPPPTSRVKSKRSRPSSTSSHRHSHFNYQDTQYSFTDAHSDEKMAIDFENETFGDLPDSSLDAVELSSHLSGDNDPCDSFCDSFEPIAKRLCAPQLDSTAFNRFSSESSSHSGLLTLHLSGTNITNKSVEVISKLYPALLDLDLSHCKHVSNLTPILLRCRALRSLNISGSPVHSHSDSLLEYVGGKPTDAGSSRSWPFLQNLENLLFSGSGTLDAGFATWMQACGPSLLELRLSNKTLPEDPVGQHIHARNARAHLAGNVPLSPDQHQHLPVFVRLLMPCERLEVIDLHGLNVSSSAMKLLFEACRPAWVRTCQEFDVINCDHVTLDTLATVFAIAEPNASGPTWPELKTLRLSGGRHAESLGGPILPAIGTYACPQLEHLVLNNARAGKALLRPVQVAQILQKFSALRSVEVWCCSSISYSLATITTQLCTQLKHVLLCVMGAGAPIAFGHAALPLHLQHAHQHGRPIAPNALAVVAAAESMTLPAFLSAAQVNALQKTHPNVEWKLWRHSADSPRQFQHIRPLSASGDPMASLRPEQPTNQLSVHVEPTGEAHVELPLRSRLIRASVLVDGVPIWRGEKSASMHQLAQSIWGLVTHNAGAIPLVEDWCCACNIEEFNGVLFYDDAEYVYWDVLEPGPKAQFKFHKGQYVAAIAAAMQQQWNIFKSILPAEELVQQALLFTQQHAWHQQLLEKSKQQLSPPQDPVTKVAQAPKANPSVLSRA